MRSSSRAVLIPCNPGLRRLIRLVVLYGVDACVGFVVIIYVTIFILCCLIYLRIRAVHRELVRYDQLASVRCERRAFGTIAMLLATLGLFFAPYMTLHVLSLNVPAATDYIHKSAVVYYMNLLPYFKFTSDPIIYGLRMREVKVGFLIVVRRCCSLQRRIYDCLCFSRGEDDFFEMTSIEVPRSQLRRVNDDVGHVRRGQVTWSGRVKGHVRRGRLNYD